MLLLSLSLSLTQTAQLQIKLILRKLLPTECGCAIVLFALTNCFCFSAGALELGSSSLRVWGGMSSVVFSSSDCSLWLSGTLYDDFLQWLCVAFVIFCCCCAEIDLCILCHAFVIGINSLLTQTQTLGCPANQLPSSHPYSVCRIGISRIFAENFAFFPCMPLSPIRIFQQFIKYMVVHFVAIAKGKIITYT